MSDQEEKRREELITEFERLRAPVLRIASAATKASRATEFLEWTLWATDPKTESDFDHEYAARKLAEGIPKWREAIENLVAALDDDAARVSS